MYRVPQNPALRLTSQDKPPRVINTSHPWHVLPDKAVPLVPRTGQTCWHHAESPIARLENYYSCTVKLSPWFHELARHPGTILSHLLEDLRTSNYSYRGKLSPWFPQLARHAGVMLSHLLEDLRTTTAVQGSSLPV